MDTKQDTVSPNSSLKELSNRDRLEQLFKNSPIGSELTSNFSLYTTRQALMRQMFFTELYKLQLQVPGVIMEFGCKWGKNLSLFTSLRGIFEPYNHNRTIVGFDTFSGLRGVTENDGNSNFLDEGFFSTVNDYENHLQEVLSCIEMECPISHIQKFQIVKGDVRETFPTYLVKNPQTIISLAYLDMDIYEPTKSVLQNIKPYLVPGSVIGFDELNWSEMPGPTLALREVMDGVKYTIHKSSMQPIPGYIVIQDI